MAGRGDGVAVDALAAHLPSCPAAPSSLLSTASKGQPFATAWLHDAWRLAIAGACPPESAAWVETR